MVDRIRVLIADDESLVRAALRVFIASTDGFELAGEARDGVEALEMAGTLQPDVILMDVQMPRMGGIEATAQVTRRFPAVKIIALATFSTDRVIVPMLRAGASGFLVKDTEPEQILDAARLARDGGCVLSPAVAGALVCSAQQADLEPAPELTPEESLTEREYEVVSLLAAGMSNAEIAATLFVSEATVKSHLGRIMTKWSVRDRVQVLIRAAQARIVSIG